MGIVIDTDVLIDFERDPRESFFSPFKAHGDAYISSITASQLLMGIQLASNEGRRSRRLAVVEGVLGLLPILDFTLESARVHAEIYAVLRARGQLIGAHDLITAATALQNGCAVLTGNLQEFSRVPGLEVVTPGK